MKLVSFQIATPLGEVTRVGVVRDPGHIVDLQSAYRQWLVERGATVTAAERISRALLPTDMTAFIEGGEPALEAAREVAAWAASDGAPYVFEQGDIRLLAPVPRPPLLRDFMAFETHLKNIYPKLGREIPDAWYEMPVYYKGNPGSIGAHEDTVTIPSYADELDYEFELGMVIGAGGMNIPAERAWQHVFGFTIYNDFSARRIQSREMSVGLGPAKGKDFAGAHVFGPYLLTKDEIPDIYDLQMVCRVNGEERCDESTATMHWRFEQLIAHASRDEWLVPGEVFGSGTVGNGSGAEIGRFLQQGDEVELEVDRLGLLRNHIG